MEYPEPTLFAIPFFLIALLVEYRLVQKRVLRGEHLAGYEARDSRASLWMGVGSIVWVGAINLGVFRLATWLYAHRVCTIESSMLVWALGLVGWDFSFYVHHRLEHEVRILWACHVSHHSSVRYNLSTALRQPWTPWPMLVLFPPWALLGVPPKAIMISGGINLIYQYWIHTETIGRPLLDITVVRIVST